MELDTLQQGLTIMLVTELLPFWFKLQFNRVKEYRKRLFSLKHPYVFTHPFHTMCSLHPLFPPFSSFKNLKKLEMPNPILFI